MPGEDAEGQARRAPWARLWVSHFLRPEGDHSKAAPAWPHSPLPPWLLSALPGMGPCRGPGFKGERSFLEQRRAEAEAAGGEPLGGAGVGMVLWGRGGPSRWQRGVGGGVELGSTRVGTFHLHVAVSNSVKPKGTFIGMWLRARLDPEAEFRQNSVSFHLSTLLPSAGCTLGQAPLAWWLPIPLYVHLSSPIFFQLFHPKS